MLWRCTLLLALCAFSCVRSMSYPNRIEYRTGGGPGNSPCSAECYTMIRQWFMQQGCNLPYGMGYGNGNGYGNGGASGTGYYGGTGYYETTRDPYGQGGYIDYYNKYGKIESLTISGPCFAYQLCDKCGPNGQCVVETYSQPECKCKEGFQGEKCDEMMAGGQNTVIIAVTVIAGLLAFFILVAVIVHICWKHNGNNMHWKKPNSVQVVNPGHHHCKPAVNHCAPPACSHGHPSLNTVCPPPLTIHTVTPNHGHGHGHGYGHGHGHQHCYPPVIGGPCYPPRSSVKITEIVEDPNYSSGAVVPTSGGLFGHAAPNVYTTIGAVPAGQGTTITL